MCYSFYQNKDLKELEDRFNAKIEFPEQFVKSDDFNGFTFPEITLISNQNPDLFQNFYWGLIPHWAKDNSIQKFTINAKIETLHEKPSFKYSLQKRCLIPVNGFFEWQWLDPKGKNKQKYSIGLAIEKIFSFAGIWAEWLNPETGKLIKSFSIITQPANDLMSKIHNSKKRMPLILNPENEQNWLAGNPIENFKNLEVDLKALKVRSNLR